MTAYDAEALLEAELADHPDLLADQQMNPSQTRWWPSAATISPGV
jgi:hypothetical protein